MHSTVYCLSILKNLFTVLLIPSFTSVLCLRGWLHGEFQPGLIFQWRKIGLVGGAELRAPKARETSRGVRGHPPRKILKSRVPEMAFPAFLGKSLQNPKRYKTFTVTYTTFTSPSAPKAGGAQPPLFSTFTKLGGFSPPPVPPPMSACTIFGRLG